MHGTRGNNIYLQFNADTGANYAHHVLYGQNGAVGAIGSASTTLINASVWASGAAGVGFPTVSLIDIIDYASTTKNKTVRTFSGSDNNNSSQGDVELLSGLWASTSAITSIKITLTTGNFDSGSSMALYGIKG